MTLNRTFLVLVVATGFLGSQADNFAQERILGGVPPVLPIKPVEIADGENELRRLLKERYNASVMQLKTLYELFLANRIPIEDVCLGIEQFAKAGSELAETPVARVSELELARDAASAVETNVTRKHADGQEPRQAMLHARVCRLGIEIDLHRAREAAKAVRDPK
jgi:hypothetical protein